MLITLTVLYIHMYDFINLYIFYSMGFVFTPTLNPKSTNPIFIKINKYISKLYKVGACHTYQDAINVRSIHGGHSIMSLCL